MIERLRNFLSTQLLLAATVAMMLAALAPASAQNKGETPVKGDGEGYYECPFGSPHENVFVADVPKDHVHHQGVVAMLCNAIMEADDGYFYPNDPAMRASASSATLLLYDFRTGVTHGHCPEGTQTPNPFEDVDEATPHGERIVKAWCIGLWKGVSSSRFEPYGSLTRAQAATIAVRTLDRVWEVMHDFSWSGNKPRCEGEQTFDDVNQDSPHHEAINQMACNGLIRGVDGARYKPQRELTRGQLATILFAADRQQPEGGNK